MSKVKHRIAHTKNRDYQNLQRFLLVCEYQSTLTSIIGTGQLLLPSLPVL